MFPDAQFLQVLLVSCSLGHLGGAAGSIPFALRALGTQGKQKFVASSMLGLALSLYSRDFFMSLMVSFL
jgi:hypothetical protein